MTPGKYLQGALDRDWSVTTANLPAIADTWLDWFEPSTNYGGNTQLYLASYTTQMILVRFDLSSIPDEKLINSLKLNLHVHTGSNETREIYAYKMAEEWVELEATFDEKSSGVSWENIYTIPKIGTVTSSVASGTWIQIPIDVATTTDLKSFHTFQIRSQIKDVLYITIDSREADSYTPSLDIDYSDVATDDYTKNVRWFYFASGTPRSTTPIFRRTISRRTGSRGVLCHLN